MELLALTLGTPQNSPGFLGGGLDPGDVFWGFEDPFVLGKEGAFWIKVSMEEK